MIPNPITQDKLHELAGEAIRRAIYISGLNNNGKAETMVEREEV